MDTSTYRPLGLAEDGPTSIAGSTAGGSLRSLRSVWVGAYGNPLKELALKGVCFQPIGKSVWGIRISLVYRMGKC